ncbi:carboxypeptidase-like regulatory domain-containing protein [uncultured Ruminococcus sp.]|uniref:carboxypeptidase-like regulatory domain-containing protein n=1 Tax=uncultured Ruminococcus sp. TaxID=165186 RepID=UPI00292F2A79|nr:carboxypeptidase-like regulatory domain-containing protein [uncultured Ruminococcus sp.]
MRRFLSILLAVMIIASVSVVSIGAADTGVAKVTMISVKGNSVTETYAVGDTITAYTYLNASQLNQGKIGSLDGAQYYTNSVLELTDEYTVNDGIFDIEGMFPITKTATMASGHWINSEEYAGMGAIYYNASIPSYSGFKFNSDTAALIVAHYKVKAAGDATIKNEMKTLAQSDYDLTRIIDRGKIVQSNFTSPVALSEPTMPVPTGSTVSGVATSYKTNDGVNDVTLTLTGSDNNYTDTVTVTASYSGNKADTAYSFANVPAGEYTLSVAKGNHVTREYTVAVSTDTTQDVKICPIGDADGNGRVNAADARKVFAKGNGDDEAITDAYALACADVSKPVNRINSADARAVFMHANGETSLWTVTAE